MSTRWSEWPVVVVAASLAILGCTGTTPGSECGGAGEACCAGNVCSGALVCGAAGQCNAAGPTYTIGGLVSGLTGTGLALRNGAETLAVNAAGSFQFATALPPGSAYAVTIGTQPSGQTCTVANGSGTVGSANVTSVAVSCTSPPATTYTIGGTVSGLTGTGLVLQDNRADNLPIAASGAFTFATALTQGDLYTVTVLSQPTGQTCSVANGVGTVGTANVTDVAVTCVVNPTPRYAIGGTVSGLAGTGLVLRNNGGDDRPIDANGTFTFATSLPGGAGYSVTVAGQPSGPSQTCTVTNGAGTVGNADVTGVTIHCITNAVPMFTVGGTVSGLTGPGLVLRNNGGDDLAVASSGTFTFATPLMTANGYAVTVRTQPSGQTCTISGGSGTVGTSNVTSVVVTCTTNPPPRYSVGGTVSGLTGPGLVLRNNGGDDLSVVAGAPFVFATMLTSGSSYSVTILTQPSGQTCSVSNGSGIIESANVTTVAVGCINDPPPTYTVGGTVSDLAGSGLVLQDNGADNLAIGGNGAFHFATALTSGDRYSVTVLMQPTGQTCTVSSGSGTIGSTDITTVGVSCVTNPLPRYHIGGTVSGLAGSGLVLRNNGGDDLSVAANGAFTFATTLLGGTGYAVTVAGQPSGPSQTCTVANGTGTVASADVTTVTVSCVTNPLQRYTIGGTVTGLSGSGLVLRNNGGDDLAVTASGTFTFASSLTSGSGYAVTVASQPSGQTCSVSNGSGTVSGANVTSVSVSCNSPPPTRPTLVQHVSSSTNLIGRGLIGNNYRFTLPNPVRTGNVLILGISYGAPAGQVVTVHDSQGNSWPASPAVSQTDPDGNIASAIFVLPNALAGITTVTVAFSSPIRETIFQYTISEFQGVATAAPVSGTGRSSGAQPAISTGTFTPSNNDANGGNLIWSYFADSYGTTGFATEATRFTAGAGFTLLDADISWPTGSPPFPHASQYQVQTTAGPLTPSMTVTHDDGGGDVYLGVAVALRASPGAGTSPPPGMRIVHLSHLTTQLPDAGAWRLQFPSSGNLIVLTKQEQNTVPAASVTDNLGNSYQRVAPDDSVPQFWIAQGPAATSPTLEMTVNLTGGHGSGVTYLLYDIAGASASSFEGYTFKTLYDNPTGSDVFDSPVITPLTAPGLTITATAFGQGPSSGLGPGCPAGAIFDFVYYTGETDLDTMDNADFRAHVFNTDTSTQHWNIAVANGNIDTNVSSLAVHFK